MEEKTPLKDVRNIGIIAHIDAGKTTTTERILFYTGVIHKMGTVDDGNATMDWMEQEQERGITITAANTTCFWKKHKLNIIDTPGHVDFTVEVERSLKVLDGAVVVLCATSGVQSQTETVWRQADRYGVPRLLMINKMDRLGASFERTLEQILERFDTNAAAVQFPNDNEERFNAIVDVIEGKYFIYKNDAGDDIEETDIPEEYQEKYKEYHHTLIERLADADDEIAEKFLGEETLTKEDIKAGIRRAVIANKFNPVYCGSSLKNKGVQKILDAVLDFLPSPLDLPPLKGSHPEDEEKEVSFPPDSTAPLSALVFKIATDPYVGKIYYTRVYSGTMSQGQNVLNSSNGKKERIAKILVMHSNKQEIVPTVSAGEIVAIVGLKTTKSGESLCTPENPIVIESMNIPEPVVSMSIEPKTKADQDKLGLTLRKFLDEDPSLAVAYDHETCQTIISGMGELHLEIIIDRMKREFGLETTVGRPQVAYKEAITKAVDKIIGKHVTQTGGKGQYGHVVINVEPSEEKGKGFVFIDKIKGGAIPREYIPAVKKGIDAGLKSGILAGYPVTDVTITLVDGSYHDVDSSELAFQLAAKKALKEALRVCKSVFLEPIMEVETESPEEFASAVLGDLNQRRAKILEMGQRGNLKTSRVEVPLSEMFNYINALRSLSQGRASFSMEPKFYAEVPQYIADKIIGENAV